MKKVKFEKKLNKWIVGAVLGTAILGMGGFGFSKKGKSFFGKLKEKLKKFCGFMGDGIKEMKKNIKK